MFVNQHTDIAGNITLFDPADPSRTLIIPASADQEARVAQIEGFFGPDLSLPASIPMDQVMVFLAATDQQAGVDAYVESLGPVVVAKYRSAVQFVPVSPFGEILRAALLPASDGDWADLCRAMAATTFDDYAAAEPALVAAIAKFSTADVAARL